MLHCRFRLKQNRQRWIYSPRQKKINNQFTMTVIDRALTPPKSLIGLSRCNFLSFSFVSPTYRLYGELTNCTFVVALQMECYWPNRLVDEFFIRVHKHYFHDCSLSGRLLKDPPNHILGPFIVVPILVTLLMTALVVWRSKRSEGIV